MSSERKQRLRLFESGNTKCPICLADFTEAGVASGEGATLEHVPPKGLAKELGLRSLAMCLTCKPCNEAAGHGIDRAAAVAARPPKGRIDIEGLPHTVWVDAKGNLSVRSRLSEPPPGERPEFMRPGGKLVIQFSAPSPRYANLSYLRAAYLSVFSLLGKAGYLFAENPALLSVRDQILRPADHSIDKYAVVPSLAGPGDGIYMFREPITCWGVRMGRCLVLLPVGDRGTFYGEAGPLGLTIGAGLSGGPFWYPAKFETVEGRILTYAEGVY